jgi:hypothetical protein
MKNDQEFRTFLKTGLAPIGESQPERDLWPDVQRRLNSRIAVVPWFDYAVAALLVAAIFFFPETLLYLIYHL